MRSSVASRRPLRVRFYGEGRTDRGTTVDEESRAGFSPSHRQEGVVPILVRSICGDGGPILRLGFRIPHLRSRNLGDRVRFAMVQCRAAKDQAVVFVKDTEGIQATFDQLAEGRQRGPQDVATVVGAPHPKIEAWLFDSEAIKRALELRATPAAPAAPESLSADENDPQSAKRILAQLAGRRQKKDLGVTEKEAIARCVDTSVVRTKCPSFERFAAEVETRLRPLLVEQ